jgi:hypothetical protein
MRAIRNPLVKRLPIGDRVGVAQGGADESGGRRAGVDSFALAKVADAATFGGIRAAATRTR